MHDNDKLRVLMGRGQWSPQDVADILGRSRQTVYGWVCNSRRVPQDVLKVLALTLSVKALKEKIRGLKKN